MKRPNLHQFGFRFRGVCTKCTILPNFVLPPRALVFCGSVFSFLMDSVTNSNILYFCLRWNANTPSLYWKTTYSLRRYIRTSMHIFILFSYTGEIISGENAEVLQLKSWERPRAFAHAAETAEPEGAPRCTGALRPISAEQNGSRGRVGQGAGAASPAAGRVAVAADCHQKGRRSGSPRAPPDNLRRLLVHFPRFIFLLPFKRQ